MMFVKIGLLLLFAWVIIGAWMFEPPMSGVSNPEVYRIFYFHVPVALVTFLAYCLTMYHGLIYLRNRNLADDKKSSTAALLGTIFCILATISGSIFAKQTWGMYWNWDPRETSIVVLLLTYLAYFSLRSAIADPLKKANLSAVYSILGFIAAVFTIFIWPRIVSGLHPGAPGDPTGPFIVMSTKTWLVFGPSILAFAGLYYWLYSLSLKISRLEEDSINA